MKNKYKVLAIVLARSSSSRLNNKMFLKLGKYTVIDFFIQRLKKCKRIDKIVLTTSYKKIDYKFKKIALKNKVSFIRGPEKNVVKRLINVLNRNKSYNYIVRANADNPLIMPTIIDNDIDNFLISNCDLFTPFDKNMMPFGYNLTIFKRKTIIKIDQNSKLPKYREHVENYCLENQKKFKILRQKKYSNLYGPNIFLSLDTIDDYFLIKKSEKFIRKISYDKQPIELIKYIKNKC